VCGIAGIVGPTPDRLGATRRILNQLIHRGPDDAGEFNDEHCTLGMRRLSIIDVVGGHQPLINEKRDVACICNGELYNFQTLAAELKRLGHTFSSGSDVEIALHGYESWGDDVLQRINGMFALAIWDAPRRRLLLARDRVGKKPLYYARLQNGLAFASELRSLLTLPNVVWRIDTEACRAFCQLGYMPCDRTPISEIRRLAPGHLAVWVENAFTIRPYWEPDPSPAPTSEEEATDLLFDLLRDAVRLRLISDVPLGAFASGGLDSSVVIAMAAGQLGARVPTFTVSFPGYPHFDEATYGREVAEHFGCEHHVVPVDFSSFTNVADLAWALDEPLADPAALPTLLLSREARKVVTVALTGEGGDEVFGGYERYSLALHGTAIMRRLGALRTVAAAGLHARGRRRFDDSRFSRVLRSLVEGGSNAFAWNRVLSSSPGIAHAAGWNQDKDTNTLAHRKPRQEANRRRLLALQEDDLATSLANGLLTKVDRMTMAASLEARCPLLDYRIVNFGLGLPDDWKIRRATTKVVLRRVARRLLPPAISERAKHTFRVPLAKWLRGPLKQVVREVASSPLLSTLGIIERSSIAPIVEDHLQGRADFGRALWALITLHLWFLKATQEVSLERPSE
jgi:asparagine synthase (glutamine-hydrolysing)